MKPARPAGRPLSQLRVIVTGSRGTVGTPLVARLRECGAHVVPWDRREVDPLDPDACRAFVHAVRPDRIFHLGIASTPSGARDEGVRVNRQWPEVLARAAHEVGAGFLFTSTAMVFSNHAVGPFTLEQPPDAVAGYGYEKHEAERAVMAAHPGAVVVRLGWQIHDTPEGNHMVAHFHREVAREGYVRASTRWLPACSFLSDTVEVLLDLAPREGGVYMLDANERWSFHAIACALRETLRTGWDIEATDDFVYDQRMLDPRVHVPSISSRMPSLENVTLDPDLVEPDLPLRADLPI
jgi:dTDP-4-dehydrorhamnose reductase